MDCRKIEQVIFRFLYGEAGLDELRQIKAHLDRCGHCRRESETIALILSQLKDSMTNDPVPEGLKERVLARIHGAAGD